LIYEMLRNSAAYQSGLQPLDVVVSFNGTPVEDPGHFSRLVSDARIGSVATIGVIRKGRRMDLKITITRPANR
jgi:S1-C subfamily serine protease